MSINLQTHAFAGNPIRSKTLKSADPLSSNSAFETLKVLLLDNTHQSSSPNFKVLPFRKGRPLASSSDELNSTPIWHLGWMSLSDCKGFLTNSEVSLGENSLVYLGSRSEDEVVFWAIDVSADDGLVGQFGKRQCCFVELRPSPMVYSIAIFGEKYSNFSSPMVSSFFLHSSILYYFSPKKFPSPMVTPFFPPFLYFSIFFLHFFLPCPMVSSISTPLLYFPPNAIFYSKFGVKYSIWRNA